jgi:aspartate/glutamate racemase
MALEQPGEELALPGLHIADVVVDRAARDGRTRVGVLGTRYLMDGPIYPRAFADRASHKHGRPAEDPAPPDRQQEIVAVFPGNARHLGA